MTIVPCARCMEEMDAPALYIDYPYLWNVVTRVERKFDVSIMTIRTVADFDDQKDVVW